MKGKKNFLTVLEGGKARQEVSKRKIKNKGSAQIRSKKKRRTLMRLLLLKNMNLIDSMKGRFGLRLRLITLYMGKIHWDKRSTKAFAQLLLR
jgi:hypothetical protein